MSAFHTNLRSLALATVLSSGVLSSMAWSDSPAGSILEFPKAKKLATRSTDRRNVETMSSELAAARLAANQHYNLGADTVALSGYDPVNYFTQLKPLKGRKELSTTHQGITYYFGNEQNLRLFTESPAKYLPAYGGWCATAMAKGDKVEIDPTNFKVTNGRLFLFFKAFYGNALKDWNKDESALTAKADAHWKRLSGE